MAKMFAALVFVAAHIVAAAASANRSTPAIAVNPLVAEAGGVAAIEALASRRLPAHLHSLFEFTLDTNFTLHSSGGQYQEYDAFSISAREGESTRIQITGASTSALSRGLLTYLRSIGGDITWSGDNFAALPAELPNLKSPITGASWSKLRYAFNVVTYSYTAAFYSWDEWEYLLDWCSLHGINFPLAIGGQEYIWREVYRDFGLNDTEIYEWLPPPAFESWERMGNIHGAWPSPTPETWTNDQWALQQKIVQRMVALGMTPVLPGFAGFVPAQLQPLIGGPSLIVASQWESMPLQYTEDTAVDATWSTYAVVQAAFLKKQYELYGNWTSSYYSLDLFNELSPPSLDVTYLMNNTRSVVDSLRAVDPNAVWVMQGWLFVSATYWNQTTISALLSGAQNDEMIVLDLASEAIPAWNVTNNYYGKPWVWNLLHDYGQNQGLYGSLSHYASEPLRALANSSSTLLGTGITMEGMNQNELVYEFTLDSPWQLEPLDVSSWLESFITRRYSLSPEMRGASDVYKAWQLLATTAYNNTDFAVQAVIKSIFELIPADSGLTGRTGHHPTLLTYDPVDVVRAWNSLIEAVKASPELLDIAAFQYDFVDVTRQVFANAFIPAYNNLISAWNTSTPNVANITKYGNIIEEMLSDLDVVLSTDTNFLLYNRIADARGWARNSSQLEYMEYQARNQITIWGPETTVPWALDRYASKQWNVLVREFYIPGWQQFVSYLSTHDPQSYNTTEWLLELRTTELAWQTKIYGQGVDEYPYTIGNAGELVNIMQTKWRNMLISYYGREATYSA